MSTRPHDKTQTMKTNETTPPEETNAAKQQTSGGRCASTCSPSYVRYGPEWEAELMKLPKKFIIGMLRKKLATPTPTTDAMASMRRTHQEWQNHSDKLEFGLREMVRIVEAVRMSMTLGKTQLDRLARAKSILENEISPSVGGKGKAND